MKKIYVLENEKQQQIKKLQELGVVVTATCDKIEYIEIDTAMHNIANIETLTGLKFEEAKQI